MRRLIFVLFCLTATPALACDDPTSVMSREPVPEAQHAAYGAAFDTCLEGFKAKLTPETADILPVVLSDILRLAIGAGDGVVVQRMIDEGVSLSAADNDFPMSPITMAASRNHPEVTRLLLAAGADPNGDRETPVSPLALALRDAHADVARQLYAAGGEIRRHPHTPQGMTLLEETIYAPGNVPATVALLMEMGEDPSIPFSRGGYPIQVAAALGQGETIRVLVAAGADVETRNHQGHTPLETAAGTFNGLSALPALIDLQATEIDAALKRAELNREEMNIAYLKAIADPEQQQAILDQAVVSYIQRLRGYNIDKLLRAGANPNTFRGTGHPLHVTNCTPLVGDILLEFGADPDLARVNGAAPDWAAECATFADETHAYMERLGYITPSNE